MSEQTEHPAEIPQETLDIATEENALKQGWATVLGTLVTPSDSRALVRFRDGRIETVTQGDPLGRGTVLAIEDGALMLAVNGETRRMPVAGS